MVLTIFNQTHVLWCLSNGEEWIFGVLDEERRTRSLSHIRRWPWREHQSNPQDARLMGKHMSHGSTWPWQTRLYVKWVIWVAGWIRSYITTRSSIDSMDCSSICWNCNYTTARSNIASISKISPWIRMRLEHSSKRRCDQYCVLMVFLWETREERCSSGQVYRSMQISAGWEQQTTARS